MRQSEFINPPIFNTEQNKIIENFIRSFDEIQLTWLAGYLTGISQSVRKVNPDLRTETEHTSFPELTVLYGSRTGNGESVAKKLATEAEAKGFKIRILDMNDYPLQKLKDEKYLLVIVSTHGEGVPPVSAEAFYDFIHGKRAPKLNHTKFSVLALGDSSYIDFCKTGKDIDQKLEQLGAERILDRFDCDVDFIPTASAWIQAIFSKFLEKKGVRPVSKVNEAVDKTSKETAVYDKQNPFKAKLLDKIKLSGRGSEKETWHYEISLEGSDLSYEPGDSLGIFAVNSQRSVYELIDSLGLDPAESIETVKGKRSLENVLTHDYELSVLSPDVLKKYQDIAQDPSLEQILTDNNRLKKFMYGRDVIDLIQEFPTELNSSKLFRVLRKMQPRLYSISSSSKAHPGEVHLTVATVRYSTGRYKEGVCSTFLADRIGDEDFFHVFIEKNPEFRLPVNHDTPVIMVGPGTGIAPFRAFLEERQELGSKGKNWLFFGDRHFTTDFLYQTELQSFHKKEVLTRLNVAFSRDTNEKIYVQHKMKQNAKDLYKWLEEGAHFYICGDMKNMWTDVNKTLIEIISAEGGLSSEAAEEYLKNLKKLKRYQVDVY